MSELCPGEPQVGAGEGEGVVVVEGLHRGQPLGEQGGEVPGHDTSSFLCSRYSDSV